ncbi:MULTISPECIES: hypothetical protein [unclassified Rhizobium]|uniref:hypothetical protein n=1 Tax=unclassified Rhizobium TaxID=2613769 RepID=UPI0015CF6192|nr:MULTISPECIES: hypothetical protein [unclassified Rhizobium]MDF0661669.1 hypothetical protein [Rhizobium sp. BC49]
MNNIIAFPIAHNVPATAPNEPDITLAQDKMKDARDQIQDVLARLIAIYNDLERAMIPSIGPSETTNSSLSAGSGI